MSTRNILRRLVTPEGITPKDLMQKAGITKERMLLLLPLINQLSRLDRATKKLFPRTGPVRGKMERKKVAPLTPDLQEKHIRLAPLPTADKVRSMIPPEGLTIEWLFQKARVSKHQRAAFMSLVNTICRIDHATKRVVLKDQPVPTVQRVGTGWTSKPWYMQSIAKINKREHSNSSDSGNGENKENEAPEDHEIEFVGERKVDAFS